MAIKLNDNIRISAGKPIDDKYLNGLVPYNSIAEVNGLIPIAERYIGLTVNIQNIEYWYELGVTDTNLVVKSVSNGGSGERIEKTYTQSGHSFNIGDVVAYSGGSFIKAIADGTQNAEVIGIVSKVLDINNFVVTFSGYLDGLSGLTLNSNTTYFLSTTVPGGLQDDDTTVLNTISKPILTTITSNDAIIFQYRGFVVTSGASGGGTKSGITNIQNIGGGAEIYSPPLVPTISGETAQLRTLVGSGNTTVTTSGDTIVISSNIGLTKEVFVTTASTVNIPATSTNKAYIASGTTGYTLPSSPIMGVEISFSDGLGNAGTNNITINGNGKNILNDTSGVINTDYGSFTILYNGIFWNVIAHVP